MIIDRKKWFQFYKFSLFLISHSEITSKTVNVTAAEGIPLPIATGHALNKIAIPMTMMKVTILNHKGVINYEEENVQGDFNVRTSSLLYCTEQK
jgi:hypothetical protein